MLIIYGSKLIRKDAGYVAAFCVVCRQLTPFRLIDIRSTGHLYFIAMGKGQHHRHEIACTVCGTAHPVEVDNYSDFCETAKPLPELLRITSARHWPRLKERMEMEEKVKEALPTLTTEERASLLREPFVLYMLPVEERFSATNIDSRMILVLALQIPWLILLLGVGDAIPALKAWILIGGLALSVVALIWQVVTAGRRWMRKNILPNLAFLLLRLRPREEELSAVLDRCGKLGWAIGQKTNLRDLTVALENRAAELAMEKRAVPAQTE